VPGHVPTSLLVALRQFLLICALFLVGDPKQSIYRFRRADVELYEQVKKSLVARGAELLHLTTSFRAVPSIQSFVNAAFAPAITADPGGGHPAYVPLQPSRPEIAGQPTVVALPVPRPYGDYGTIVNWRIDESFPVRSVPSLHGL
jgi:ATP-dependent helicase/nuclease subunit A